MARSTFVAVLRALLAVFGAGSAVAAAPAPPVAASRTADARTFDEIGERALRTGSAPGFAFAVVRGGTTVYAHGFGVADMTRNEPVTPHTRFSIGSLTKQFTAAAVLRLRDAGKLRLDDPLARYLPELPNAKTITPRMMLNQDSGLHDYPLTTEHDWPLSGAIDPRQLLAILATDRPDFEPGTKWAYSNANYAVLAAIVARAGGMPYGDYLRSEIFAPLGMAASGDGFAAQHAGIATAYNGIEKFSASARTLSLDLFHGAGSAVSTVDDLSRWDVALMRGTLLSTESMRDLWTAGTLSNGSAVPYAMGFIPATLDGHREVWHNGLTPFAGGYCYNAIFPDDDLAVIVLSNGERFGGRPEAIVRAVFQAYF
jgi:D-alanyl-D-alanine carboxypeptidase